MAGLVAAACALLAAACTDETPTLTGPDGFPPGAELVTREVLIPATQFVQTLGVHSNYTRASDAPYVVLAEDYEGVLDARALSGFGTFPSTVTYVRSGAARTDGAFTYLDSRLVARVDTAASTGERVTLQVWQAGQAWHRESATWTLAVDTGSVETPWAVPGGNPGALLGQGLFVPGGSDTVSITLPAAAMTALADSTNPGVVITVAETGARVELADLILRAVVRPDSAIPDTTITVSIPTGGRRTTIYTPEQPSGGGTVWEVGGIRSARTLFSIDPEQQVPNCAVGEACGTVPITEVRLNRVSVVLRPLPVPNGFESLGAMPLAVRIVQEPELGRFAPLGANTVDATAFFQRGDSLVEVPLTTLVASLARVDSLPRSFALMAQSSVSNAPPSFGVAFFEATPRLRILYTLPSRRRLP